MTDKTPGWIGPIDPFQPDLNVGYEDGSVANCTTHDMGECPYHTAPGAQVAKGGTPGLTDAEKLTALQTYLKPLKVVEEGLRARVTEEMGVARVERVGAYLPDGTKLGAVGYNKGRKTAKVIDSAAALAWCLDRYPDEIVSAIRPSFLKALTDYALKVQKVGEKGADPYTGEELPFIEVSQGSAFVTVTTTEEGVDRMTALANGFAGMLEAGQ